MHTENENIESDEFKNLSSKINWLEQSIFTTPIGKTVQNKHVEFILSRKKEKTPAELYISEIHDAMGNIVQSFDDIKLTIKLIEFAHPKIKSFKMTRVDRGNYLKYHYENYIFRLPKIKDQVLQLLNVAYQMGHTQSPGLEKKVRKHPKVHENKSIYLDYLDHAFSTIKPYRDIIAHRADLVTSDFAMLTSFQLVEYDKNVYEDLLKMKVSMTYVMTKNLGAIKQAIIILLMSLGDEFNSILESLSDG